MFPPKADTDVYFDAAGSPAVIDTAMAAAKMGARLGIVAVHKQAVSLDIAGVMMNEMTIVGSMGYRDEIFEVTNDIVADCARYSTLISHKFPFEAVDDALRTATTPGGSDKVVVTWG